MKDVSVLGAGSWGTALAIHLARLGKSVRLWGRDPVLIARLREERSNPTYLPGVTLPPTVSPTDSLELALNGTSCVVWAIPSHATRKALRSVEPLLGVGTPIVSGTKGFEVGTLQRISQVMEQELGSSRPVAVLSGPCFSTELARGAHTAVLVASEFPDVARTIQQEFRASYLRLYASDDVPGVEVGGAMKNVIAIAAGVVDELDLGPNALAALITRGLAEISRLASALGGRRETLAGLSGLGDLILTCTGGLSRNCRLGHELVRGRSLDEIQSGMQVAEGVRTTEVAVALGEQHMVDLPIATQMHAVLKGRLEVETAVQELMLRQQRAEFDSL